jgi:hypothetical protein
MNAVIQKALDNLEHNLQELIESVASYNPSPAAAVALVQADDELTEVLEQCTTQQTPSLRNSISNNLRLVDEHQQAHRHILALRETSDALDKQFTELLTTLSETRQQVISVPSTKFRVTPKPIPYDQLLSYATKIAKYSRPPNPVAFKKYADSVLPPPPPPPPPPPQQSESASKPPAAEQEEQEKLPLGLTQEDMVNVDPLSGMPPFMPWPNEIVMRQGALAAYMAMGPGAVPEDMVSEADKKAAEEEKKREEEVKNAVNGGPSDAEERARRPSYVPTYAPQREKPKSFDLDLFVEDDED